MAYPPRNERTIWSLKLPSSQIYFFNKNNLICLPKNWIKNIKIFFFWQCFALSLTQRTSICFFVLILICSSMLYSVHWACKAHFRNNCLPPIPSSVGSMFEWYKIVRSSHETSHTWSCNEKTILFIFWCKITKQLIHI